MTLISNKRKINHVLRMDFNALGFMRKIAPFLLWDADFDPKGQNQYT